MLKSERATKPKGPEFPCIKMHSSSKMLVLFEKALSGCVINVGNSQAELGHISHSWDMSCFIEWEGVVTLTQD